MQNPFETMIGDVIDIFENTAPAVNQKYAKSNPHKIQGLILENSHVNHVFSGYAVLLPNIQKVCTEKEQLHATLSHPKYGYVNRVFSSYVILLPNVEVFIVLNTKMNTTLPKRGPFHCLQ